MQFEICYVLATYFLPPQILIKKGNTTFYIRHRLPSCLQNFSCEDFKAFKPWNLFFFSLMSKEKSVHLKPLFTLCYF